MVVERRAINIMVFTVRVVAAGLRAVCQAESGEVLCQAWQAAFDQAWLLRCTRIWQ